MFFFSGAGKKKHKNFQKSGRSVDLIFSREKKTPDLWLDRTTKIVFLSIFSSLFRNSFRMSFMICWWRSTHQNVCQVVVSGHRKTSSFCNFDFPMSAYSTKWRTQVIMLKNHVALQKVFSTKGQQCSQKLFNWKLGRVPKESVFLNKLLSGIITAVCQEKNAFQTNPKTIVQKKSASWWVFFKGKPQPCF